MYNFIEIIEIHYIVQNAGGNSDSYFLFFRNMDLRFRIIIIIIIIIIITVTLGRFVLFNFANFLITATSSLLIFVSVNVMRGTRWRSWLMSRVRFQIMSLEFFIDLLLPAALWPWDRLSLLTEMSTRNISWGVKAAGE